MNYINKKKFIQNPEESKEKKNIGIRALHQTLDKLKKRGHVLVNGCTSF